MHTHVQYYLNCFCFFEKMSGPDQYPRKLANRVKFMFSFFVGLPNQILQMLFARFSNAFVSHELTGYGVFSAFN